MQDGMGLSQLLPNTWSEKPTRSCTGAFTKSKKDSHTILRQGEGASTLTAHGHFLLLFLKKRWHRGVGGSPFALVSNCCKSHLLPCVLPQREHYPPQQPGLAMSGSSDCPEVNPSPPRDSGAALSPRLSASSSGRPL